MQNKSHPATNPAVIPSIDKLKTDRQAETSLCGRVSADIFWVKNRRDRACLVGHDCAGKRLYVHRIHAKEDVKQNLITLCRKHRALAQAGYISEKELFEILKERYGYEDALPAVVSDVGS